jgi:hypothetical protein
MTTTDITQPSETTATDETVSFSICQQSATAQPDGSRTTTSSGRWDTAAEAFAALDAHPEWFDTFGGEWSEPVVVRTVLTTVRTARREPAGRPSMV